MEAQQVDDAMPLQEEHVQGPLPPLELLHDPIPEYETWNQLDERRLGLDAGSSKVDASKTKIGIRWDNYNPIDLLK